MARKQKKQRRAGAEGLTTYPSMSTPKPSKSTRSSPASTPNPSKSTRSGGKRKKRILQEEEEENDVADLITCGICLLEEGKAVGGQMDCCSHYFCYVCIMEWAKKESLCPICKQRFRCIRRPPKDGVFACDRIVEVPVRDQAYSPLRNDSRGPSDPHACLYCTECQSSEDQYHLLLCDLCNSAMHTFCVGLGVTVPDGNWYCHDCTVARNEHTKRQLCSSVEAISTSSSSSMNMDVSNSSRVRPAASNRRKWVRQPEVDLTEDPQPQVEEEAPDVTAEPAVVVEETTGPFPGGPTDWSLIPSFRTHIAASIWNQQERLPLKCINHAKKISEWAWNTKGKPNQRFSDLVAQSGLTTLITGSYRYINKNLVSSFVERWHPETNTFHMPYGEMTISLDDVGTILGIPVTGRSLSADTLSHEGAQTLLCCGLGVTPQEAHEELSQVRGSSVRLEWLRELFGEVSDADSDERIRNAARAYLLYLLGCTLFTDKSGTRVPVIYLNVLMNFDEVRLYAWGAAALAYLYRQLGMATRKCVKQIAGYLTLLEAWIYEHFQMFRPQPNLHYLEELPRVHRWVPQRESGDQMATMQMLREAIDRLGSHEVIWDPYRDHRRDSPIPGYAYYTGCLKCIDVVEPYHPDRVLRQFGRVQTIPPAPLPPTHATRGSTAAQYRIAYCYFDRIWERWENHVLAAQYRSMPVMHPWDCMPGYMDWYAQVSHLIVQNPKHHSTYDPRVQDYQGTSSVDPQLRIANARNILQPFIQRGYDMSIQDPGSLYIAVEQALGLLDGLSLDDIQVSRPRRDTQSYGHSCHRQG